MGVTVSVLPTVLPSDQMYVPPAQPVAVSDTVSLTQTVGTLLTIVGIAGVTTITSMLSDGLLVQPSIVQVAVNQIVLYAVFWMVFPADPSDQLITPPSQPIAPSVTVLPAQRLSRMQSL